MSDSWCIRLRPHLEMWPSQTWLSWLDVIRMRSPQCDCHTCKTDILRHRCSRRPEWEEHQSAQPLQAKSNTSFPWSPRGEWPLLTSCLWIYIPHKSKTAHFCCLNLPLCTASKWQPWLTSIPYRLVSDHFKFLHQNIYKSIVISAPLVPSLWSQMPSCFFFFSPRRWYRFGHLLGDLAPAVYFSAQKLESLEMPPEHWHDAILTWWTMVLPSGLYCPCGVLGICTQGVCTVIVPSTKNAFLCLSVIFSSSYGQRNSMSQTSLCYVSKCNSFYLVLFSTPLHPLSLSRCIFLSGSYHFVARYEIFLFILESIPCSQR